MTPFRSKFKLFLRVGGWVGGGEVEVEVETEAELGKNMQSMNGIKNAKFIILLKICRKWQKWLNNANHSTIGFNRKPTKF